MKKPRSRKIMDKTTVRNRRKLPEIVENFNRNAKAMVDGSKVTLAELIIMGSQAINNKNNK